MDPGSTTETSGVAAEGSNVTSQAQAPGWNEQSKFDYDKYESAEAPSEGWYGNSAVYEWKGEYGDIGPKVPLLEEQLFRGVNRMREGEHRDALNLEVAVAGPTKCTPVRSVSKPDRSTSLTRYFTGCSGTPIY